MKKEEFKAQLKARGWTQKDFSERTGTPRRTIEDWAAGKNRIPPIVERYFEALDEIDRLRSRIASLGGKI